MKPKNNKPIVGENLLYFMVWAMAILVPILNSKMMSEEHVYLVNILTAWSKLLPYFIVFLLNNALLAPKLLLRKHYAAYLIVSALTLSGIFYALEYYQESIRLTPVAGAGTLHRPRTSLVHRSGVVLERVVGNIFCSAPTAA